MGHHASLRFLPIYWHFCYLFFFFVFFSFPNPGRAEHDMHTCIHACTHARSLRASPIARPSPCAPTAMVRGLGRRQRTLDYCSTALWMMIAGSLGRVLYQASGIRPPLMTASLPGTYIHYTRHGLSLMQSKHSPYSYSPTPSSTPSSSPASHPTPRLMRVLPNARVRRRLTNVMSA